MGSHSKGRLGNNPEENQVGEEQELIVKKVLAIVKGVLDNKFEEMKKDNDSKLGSISAQIASLENKMKRDYTALRHEINGLKRRRPSLPEIETIPDGGGASDVLGSWPIRPGF